ncbi:hypothetical protein FOA43_004530 [Brettanomyces nanus]|uniref:Actin cytoskeleton-regulatory complex protein END3 n=1 Tax=Eeniella nana TaxID=13502 RepID=A0A875S709_EENNA|nr:uncharacterized protein FOA43_004530 [Brettanomyces nanus]QPG77126.1 hypothetical protein FOA43_004530 [Brettanomyces nanus]
MPRLEEWEIKKYWQIFCGLKPDDNRLSKEQLDPVFKNSHLPEEILSQIWDLADIDKDLELDFEEFCIAMRIIFDMVNGNIKVVPESLPGWLIPGSKRSLIGGDDSSDSAANNGSDSDDDVSLSDDFDWYISPTDKSTYETVYNASCDRFGRISFNSLNDLYKTLEKVPATDASSAWNLVNPKQSENIDRDQCMVFLHILNQRSHGRRVPRSVPSSLRATFSKEQPEYDITSHQADVKPQKPIVNGRFASSYLKKMGVSSGSNTDDLENTNDKDWEEVKLRRELKELTDTLDRVEKAKKGKSNKLSMAKYEYEQLLKYKESQLKELGKNSDLRVARESIKGIEGQIQQLKEFFEVERNELIEVNK